MIERIALETHDECGTDVYIVWMKNYMHYDDMSIKLFRLRCVVCEVR